LVVNVFIIHQLKKILLFIYAVISLYLVVVQTLLFFYIYNYLYSDHPCCERAFFCNEFMYL